MNQRRDQWRRAVRAAQFPVGMRPVKATLLSLPVKPDGMVTAWRWELSEATGLPLGTLKRHLAAAVKAGWLRHEVHGGHGRKGSYKVNIPGSCGPLIGRNRVELWPIHYTATPQSCGPSGEPLNNDSANTSERVALDNNRGRRDDHDDTRAPPDRHATAKAQRWKSTSQLANAAISPTRRCVCGGLRVAS